MTPRHILPFVLILGFLLGSSSPAAAWDRERKGFILGIEGGPGAVLIIEDIPGFFGPRPRASKFALAANMQIGYAPTNQIELYIMGNSSWFSRQGTFTLNQLSGLGMTYYPKQGFLPAVPSPFVTFGIGRVDLKPFGSGLSHRSGLGITFGGGYEFKNRVRLHGTFTWSNPSEKINAIQHRTFPWTISTMVGILGY